MEKMDAVAPCRRCPRKIAWISIGCCPGGTGRVGGGRRSGEARIAPNTLSFHLDRLRHAGLLSVARQGRSLIYAARYETMTNLLGYLTDNCCGGGQSFAPCCLRAGEIRPQAQEGDLEMKRLHVHVAVDDLETAIGFYSTLFAATPSVVKADYAKWMLEDPRVNFAISMRGSKAGLNHLGIQVESEAELAEVYGR
jgi:hypothetical protein